MPETKSRTRAAVRRNDDDFAGGGVLAGFVDRVFENPAMSGGVVVMALTAAAIVSNAMFLQGVRHPDPIFSTRPAEVVKQKPPATVPIPRSRADHVGSIAPIPRAAPSLDKPAVPSTAPAALVADLQTALAGKGLYRGAIDGKYGSQTRAAIAAFETQEGLPVTGQPSEVLLGRARAVPSGPAETVIARTPDPIAEKVGEPDPVAAPAPESPSIAERTSDAGPRPLPAIAAGTDEAAAPVRSGSEAESLAMRTPEPQASVRPAAKPRPPIGPAVIEEARYRRVQAALNDIGYGPVTVDGRASEETADAIRRFELDNGLPLKGTANDRMMARLIKIGAMPAN